MSTPQQSRKIERPIRVLSASVDPGLNRARGLLLQHHGCEVVTSESLQHAREQIENSRFDVLIFGSTLPSDTCWQLAEAFRKRNAAGRIIEILPSPWAAPKNRPDATIVSSEEPTKLITLVRHGMST